ncbi:hypothetical protein PVAG01_05455 [Phlyctema vagabunda]|uniref:Uncharacterized protein n=1 Tax=Phlyctema vagabunda TaxID=108571 RepID=A0ABR4PK50_9HELO
MGFQVVLELVSPDSPPVAQLETVNHLISHVFVQARASLATSPAALREPAILPTKPHQSSSLKTYAQLRASRSPMLSCVTRPAAVLQRHLQPPALRLPAVHHRLHRPLLRLLQLRPAQAAHQVQVRRPPTQHRRPPTQPMLLELVPESLVDWLQRLLCCKRGHKVVKDNKGTGRLGQKNDRKLGEAIIICDWWSTRISPPSFHQYFFSSLLGHTGTRGRPFLSPALK